MVKIREAIVVEGRYDKNTLSQIVDAPIFETGGFQIHKDKEQLALLRQVAQKRGLVVFTDSDGAGFVIRNHVKSAIDNRYLKHAYIPDVYGKERRKAVLSKDQSCFEDLPEEIRGARLLQPRVLSKLCAPHFWRAKPPPPWLPPRRFYPFLQGRVRGRRCYSL